MPAPGYHRVPCCRVSTWTAEKVSRSRIKRLRGKQLADYRLRVRDPRVFYTVNVEDATVVVLRILHKKETREFYRKEEP